MTKANVPLYRRNLIYPKLATFSFQVGRAGFKLETGESERLTELTSHFLTLMETRIISSVWMDTNGETTQET